MTGQSDEIFERVTCI